MLGTIVNTAAIIIGSLLGLLLRKLIKPKENSSLLSAIGMVVIIIGLLGLIKNMIYYRDDALFSQHELSLLIFLVIGALLGDVLKLDDRINQFGVNLGEKFNNDHLFNGFITASLIFCIGAMAIIGPVQSVMGNHEVLYVKALIDGITACILTINLGFSVILASISVLLYQGTIALLSLVAYDFLMEPEFNQVFNMVGYILIMGIGWNFISEKKIKVANFLPSLLLVVLYYVVYNLIR